MAPSAWAGKRFEVPSRYRHLEQLHVGYARWNLSEVELIDPHTLGPLCPVYPLDKSANANAQRRALQPRVPEALPSPPPTGAELPALLRKLLADYAATGRPPAYLPKHPHDPEPST